MTDLLQRITSYKREEVARAREQVPQAELRAAAKDAPEPRGFLDRLRRTADSGGHAVITEIKKRSPSKGLIRPDFDPAELARSYERGGAACLSVLTDGPSFAGSAEHLAAARAASALPALRKDFMIDAYQVYESRVQGADCILVMLSTVDESTARGLEEAAHGLGMDVLVEAHDEAELERALGMDSPLVGINNRDLKTFHTTLETCERLAPKVPSDRQVVGESGIRDRGDLERLASVGVRAFLVGEHLMRHPDVAAATRSLLT